jgi:hypothetical protein
MCILCGSIVLIACGSGVSRTTTVPGLFSGNWQFTLNRVANPIPLTYSGFLLQTGNLITGSLILGGECAGVGPVTGTITGQTFQLDVNESGQDLTLTGAIPSGGAGGVLLGGQFSTLGGGCTDASTGTWTSIQVTPLNGTFHGTLVSQTNGTVDVTGALSQGPNGGASNAPLSGSMVTSSVPPFCSYATTATITGQISGTVASLFLFGANGAPLNADPIVAAITANGSGLSGSYSFQSISKACPGDIGTLQLSFP